MLTITSFTENHVNDATTLVGLRYKQLCRNEPNLPLHYAQVNVLAPLLEGILRAGGPGVVAIRGSRLVGFLTGWQNYILRL